MADEQQFQVDGVTYSSLDEVPEPFRSQLAAMLDDPAQIVPEATSMSVTTQRFTVNGVTYDSIDDVPPEIRQHLTGILVDHDGNGRPDIMDALFDASGQRPTTSAHSVGPARPAQFAAPATGHSPIVRRAGMSSKAKLVTTMIVIDVVVLGVVLWFVAR